MPRQQQQQQQRQVQQQQHSYLLLLLLLLSHRMQWLLLQHLKFSLSRTALVSPTAASSQVNPKP